MCARREAPGCGSCPAGGTCRSTTPSWGTAPDTPAWPGTWQGKPPGSSCWQCTVTSWSRLEQLGLCTAFLAGVQAAGTEHLWSLASLCGSLRPYPNRGAVCMASCPTAEPTAGPQTKRPAGHLPWLTLHPSVLPASRGCIHHHLTQSGYVQSEHPYLGLTNVLAQTQSSSLECLTGALGTGFPSWLGRFLESCGSFSAPGGDRA